MPKRYRESCVTSIDEFIEQHGLPGIVICSRISEYTELPVRLKLNAAICVQSLTDKQISQYINSAIGRDQTFIQFLRTDQSLYNLAKTPLFLSILCLAHKNSPEKIRNLAAVQVRWKQRKYPQAVPPALLSAAGGGGAEVWADGEIITR